MDDWTCSFESGGVEIRGRVTADVLHGVGSAEYGRSLLQKVVADAGRWLLQVGRDKARFQSGAPRPPMTATIANAHASLTADALIVAGQQVMQAWERPLMEAMVEGLDVDGADVLEVGFGMGIAATLIQERRPRSHTIVEINPAIVEHARAWQRRCASAAIRIVAGDWREVALGADAYDAVLFDTFSDDEAQAQRIRASGKRPVEDFVAVAARVLRSGGRFTYFTDEFDSLPRTLQATLLAHFDRLSLRRVRGLAPPPQCHYWFTDRMLVALAGKA